MLAVGLMSGTSLDGIDAALVRLRPHGASYRIDLLNFLTMPFEDDLMDRLHAILPPNQGTVAQSAHLHQMLGRAFALAAAQAAGDTPIDYVASHGQTVWHDGDAHVTLQLGDAFLIRERARATVCYDFRSADCAAGGHGAPLVPYVDALLLGSEEEDRVAVNIGGIANLTVMARAAKPADVIAFDSGPGNMLIDAFVRDRSKGTMTFDRNGELGLNGRVHEPVLRTLLDDPYFAAPPPKTTGRERFGGQFLRLHETLLEPLSLEDGAATLAALTAATIANAVCEIAPEGARVLVSGGGTHNAAILRGLQERLASFTVERSDAMNLHSDAKEAIAFAVLGYETLRERAANVPRVTGAAHPAILGAIAPYELSALIAKVQSECRV
jgi:anhydro-N-acetylmuramic acid kinase